MNKHQQQVADFHKAFDVPIEPRPMMPERSICELRKSLIKEEFEEFRDAVDAADLIGIADALADLLYVIYGAGLAFGIDLEPVFEEVHRSNMSKVGGWRRDDGKWMKPDSYSPANLGPIIEAQILAP